jgi:hypothetical protein
MMASPMVVHNPVVSLNGHLIGHCIEAAILPQSSLHAWILTLRGTYLPDDAALTYLKDAVEHMFPVSCTIRLHQSPEWTFKAFVWSYHLRSDARETIIFEARLEPSNIPYIVEKFLSSKHTYVPSS